MTDLQQKLLGILEWFHNVCEENGLKYYLLGGTMLGAARHQGFIPWDDDIDVGMPREDYQRLAVILSGNKNDRYVLETPDTNAKDYYYPFSKIYDTSTTLIEHTKYRIKRGIYLDIFPIDGIGDSVEESKDNYKKIKKLHQLLVARVTGIRKGRSLVKNAMVVLMRVIPNCIIDDKKILKKLTDSCARKKYDECKYVGNLVGAWQEKEIMPKDILGLPQKMRFEGIEVYGVEHPDEYLTYLYGDWRKLPPKEKQVTHHDFLMIDLHHSYRE